jgi:hypothetical protein
MKYLIISTSSLFIGLLLGVTISEWGHRSTVFLDIKLVEIIDIILTVLVAIFFTIFVSDHLNNRQNKKNIAFSELQAIETQLREITSLSLDYMRSPSDNLARQILSSLKKISSKYAFISTIVANHKLCKKPLGLEFPRQLRKLKSSLTGKEFLTSAPTYSEKQIGKFVEKSETAFNTLTEMKLTIYV